MSTFTLTIILFLIMDPLGNIASVTRMLEGIPKVWKRWILFREMCIALCVMLLFSLIGEKIFGVLEISKVAVRLSSGIIMFLFALHVLFPDMGGIRRKISPQEPFIIPLAIPLIAGPALLATIMLYSDLTPTIQEMFGAIFIAWLTSFFFLLSGDFLKKYLGNNGLLACEKLTGMILILLAIQRFLDGIEQLIHTL